MIAQGTFLRVRTKTKDDVFGEVIFEVVEVGLPCRVCGGEDALKCVMLGGTGKAARPGYLVHDCEKVVTGNIASGQTQVVPENQARAFAAASRKTGAGPSRASTGCIEI